MKKCHFKIKVMKKYKNFKSTISIKNIMFDCKFIKLMIKYRFKKINLN